MPAIPKFVVLSEQLRGQMFELKQDEITIGRSDERTICLKDQPSVRFTARSPATATRS
ncbi:MAG: hypothetical protein IKC53_07890 [Lentisphaeria bacterium]|nr:hypothetical protein [Lentisphaeria bacterium]